METVKITLKRSFIGVSESHKKILISLGLHKIDQSVVHNYSPAIKGMVRRVSHMVEVAQLRKSKTRKTGSAQEKDSPDGD